MKKKSIKRMSGIISIGLFFILIPYAIVASADQLAHISLFLIIYDIFANSHARHVCIILKRSK